MRKKKEKKEIKIHTKKKKRKKEKETRNKKQEFLKKLPPVSYRESGPSTQIFAGGTSH